MTGADQGLLVKPFLEPISGKCIYNARCLRPVTCFINFGIGGRWRDRGHEGPYCTKHGRKELKNYIGQYGMQDPVGTVIQGLGSFDEWS